MNENMMSAKETAQYLKISYWLLLQLVKKNQIPHAKLGNKIIFRKETIDNYISKCENSSICNCTIR